MKTVKLFAPIDIEKVDPEQHMVYGYASTEAEDSQGEIVKIDALRAAVDDYMQFANIREMHQPSAVGVAKEASIDNKGLYIAAKVVDSEAWEKVKEGVYKGFSIGGRVLDMDGNTITRLKLGEISLVDRPANPEATFDVFKMDDEELKKDMHTAAALTSMGESVDYMSDLMQSQGKDTSHMDAVTQAIADAATKELENPDDDGDADNQKEEAQETGMAMAEEVDDLAKAKLDAKEENALPAEEFAYVDSQGGRHLPINDESHVRNAMARFNQTHFESDEAKTTAKKKICSKAKSMGIEGDFCKADEPEMTKRFIMPTDDEIVEQLNKDNLPINEASIAMVKEAFAQQILDSIRAEQEAGINHDAALLQLEKDFTAAVKNLSDAMAKANPTVQPFVYYKLEKTDAVVEEPETPTIIEPAEIVPAEEVKETADTPTLTKTDTSLTKFESLLSKLETDIAKAVKTLASLEERLAVVEKTEAAPKMRTSLVERFEDSVNKSDETALMAKIDLVHEQLVKDPTNLVLRQTAEALNKKLSQLRRA